MMKERAVGMTEELQENAGINASRDRYLVGYMAAVKDLLQISVEEVALPEEEE